MVQIEEGAACDVFFSAAVKQMNQLDDTDGLVVEGTQSQCCKQSSLCSNLQGKQHQGNRS